MRDILERQIIQDAIQGDTTVLAELLNQTFDRDVFGSLDDDNQKLVTNIRALLKTYGIEVPEREDPAQVDLMMSVNYCFEFDRKVYYVSRDLSVLDDDEQVAYDYLFEYYRG